MTPLLKAKAKILANLCQDTGAGSSRMGVFLRTRARITGDGNSSECGLPVTARRCDPRRDSRFGLR